MQLGITLMGARALLSKNINRTPGDAHEGFMKLRVLSTVVTAAGVALGVTACSPAITACRVRHNYAIVIFENGGGGVGKTLVTRFRLNVKYSSYNIQRLTKSTYIKLKPVRGKGLPVVVKTYWVGQALSCHVDRIKTGK